MKLILALSILFLSCIHGVSSDSRFFTAMYSLGDSYIDAGNFLIMAAAMVPAVPVVHDKLPYGMTFFGHPTGRLSDGRNTIDFIAQEFGLPLLGPSLLNDSDASKGVNFAVGGAPAIDVDYFEKNNIVQFKLLNNSLSVQLGWFEQLRPAICNKTETSGCEGCFSKSLFFVGEFGVNDYNFLWFAGKTEDEVMSHVPTVVQNIATAVEVYLRAVFALYNTSDFLRPVFCFVLQHNRFSESRLFTM
uniref:GDSL esterase/lipase n=1 Tax=Aegilops tauschii subsp. strangulata TaxID=200361 RepID=A0A453KU56_AEGTS